MKKHSKFLKLLSLAFLVAAFTVIMMTTVSAEVVASGSFADKATYNADKCTWTYSLDSDGTLTIGGTGTETTTFQYASSYNDLSNNSYSQIPWKNSGKIGTVEIKKVIIEESTGITTLGTYALGYLKFMEEIVIPSTVTSIGTSCFSTAQTLKTIRVHGNDDLGEGCWDLRNIESIKTYAFAGATHKTYVPNGIDVYFSEKLTSLPSATDSWNWFRYFGKDTSTSPDANMTARVTFNLIQGSYADTVLTAYVARQKTYDATAETPDTTQIDKTSTTNVELAYYVVSGNCKEDLSGYNWTLDKLSGVLTISGTSDSTTLGFTKSASYSDEGKKNCPWNEYRSLIKKVVVEEDTGITAIQSYALSYLPNCTTIILPKTCVDLSAYNIFASCTNLSSIAYCGEDVIDGIIDLSLATKLNSQLFEGSSAGKTLTVIIGKPQSISVVKWFSSTTTVNFKTYEDSLAVDIFNKFGTDSDPRATNFKFIVGNLSYICDIKGAIKMEGFSIRFEGYNGLRGIFSFNESESAKYTSSGYTLLEYGTIIASSASRVNYGTALTFNESANAFETANAKVIKAAVYQDASLSKNGVSGYVGKILGNFSNEESGDQLVRYAVSIVNYDDNYMSDVYMAAYSIYRDDTSGQLYITYADYSENNSDYSETSIYDLTLGMYKTGFCNAEDDPDGVIWGVLEACAVTLEEGTHYRAGDYDLNGEPFGATYTYKNIPVYKSSHDKNTVLTTVNYSSTDYSVYPITFTIVQDLTLTLLPDGDSYVMVYRSTAGDGKTVGLPANSEWGSPPAYAQFRGNFNSYRRENKKPGIAPLLYDISGSAPVAVGYINSTGTEVYNDGFSGTGYRCQPAPTFIESAVTNKVTTVILDHGISAVNGNSLSYLKYMKTFIYPKTFTTIGGEGFQRANSITTIAEKGGIYKEGFLDFGGVETLTNTRQFIIDTNTTANATEIRLPNVTTLPTEFIMKMQNVTTVWMGDISNRVEGFANLTGIKSIGSGMFNGCTSLTKYYLDDNVTLSSTYVGAVAGTQIFTQNKNDSVAANTNVTSGNAIYRYGYTIDQALNYPDLSAIADVRSFDTNINSSLLLITNVEDEAALEALLGENAPQVAIMDVDISAYESSGEIFDLSIVGSNGEVITTALDTIERYTQGKIIPAFRAESTAEAEAVARFMTSNAMTDLMLIAPDMSMIEAARAINNKVNGVLDCTGAGYTFDAEGLRAIKDTVKTAGLNICILPSSAATQDNVEYLTDRFVQTWFDDDDSADETVELFKLINAGAFGVVTQNTAKFIEIVESDIFALNSRTRVTKINNHNCYNRSNALGNEIATAKNAVEVYGVQSVELDVNMTGDKVLIVHHNRSDTINGTKYNYADMTYEEIKAVSGLQGIGQISLYFDYMLANRNVYDMIFRVEIKSSGHTTAEQAEALEVLVSEIGKYTDEEQAYILDHLQMVSFSSTVCTNARTSLPTVQQSYLYMAHKTVSEVLNAMLTSGYHQSLYYNAGHIDDLSISKEDYMTLLIRGNLSSGYGSKASAPSTATLFLENKAYIGLDGSANQTAANLPARLTSGASSYNVSVGGTVEAGIKQFSCADLVKYGSEGTAVTSATMHIINGDASGVTFDGTNIKGLSAGTYTVVFRYSFVAYNNTAHIYTMPVTITVG